LHRSYKNKLFFGAGRSGKSISFCRCERLQIPESNPLACRKVNGLLA
jgi:hypothetical protein